ncbi:MAG: CoA pyrophosphatase [Coriobacteriales bacterium]|jgi:8-oxo-dGTP pyrophosphatase MutT (NUDIX family)|nr:CoA pyrophosphatase [Coriobacteriales bacterium]
MNFEQVRWALERYVTPRAGAAVLVPLVSGEDGLEVILEVRALTLSVQPGDVCLPGGGIEVDESPLDAAIRETCEELCVRPSQIDVLGSLGTFDGPGGRQLHAFVAKLAGYQDTYSPDEVERIFKLPLTWLIEHDPAVYQVSYAPQYPDDYPWELVPGGRGYRWRTRTNEVPFYRGTEPLVWGATARVLRRFAEVLRKRSGAHHTMMES